MDLSHLEIIHTKSEIQEKISQLANKLNVEYKDKNPIFIGVLNGAVFFFKDLLCKISLKCRCDFIKLSSYHENKQVDEMILDGNFKYDLKGQDIIIVEDICDTGKSLDFLLTLLKEKQVASLKIVCLIAKKT